MTEVHRLSRRDACRIAVRAQRLTAQRPADLHEAIHDVSMLQIDPVSAVARSADLVLFSRLGPSYDVRDLEDAVAEQSVIELRGCYRVAEDVGLYRAEMEAWPHVGDPVPAWRLANAEWVEDNNACRMDILELLRTDGPLRLKELPDTCVRPWRSSGWNNNKNVQMLLDLLVAKGEVAVAGREGRERLWDLAERVYPDDPGHTIEEADLLRRHRRLSSVGLARAKAPAVPGEPVDVGEIGEPAVVEGVKGEWRVDPAYLDGEFEGRTALLSPLDRLIHDRKRMSELFEFDYTLEMYKPKDKRRWGYYALPILHGDELVGKLDATSERKEGVLRVDAVHEDGRWTRKRREAVDAEIEDLARWLDLEVMRL